MKTALIIGANGQDGRLLRDNLREREYSVRGVLRPGSATDETSLCLDIGDAHAVENLVSDLRPDEIYHLAAFHQSAENAPLNDGELFAESSRVHNVALINFLEAIKKVHKESRLFFAASSHVFGRPNATPQDETATFRPESVYGITKTSGIHICQYYRACHSVFASVGILYNHESPYRKSEFITKKIIKAAIRIKKGEQHKLVVGDLDAAVDWGYAPDFVEAFRRILGLDEPDDFVVATGVLHTVRDFVSVAFGHLGLDWTSLVEEDRSLLSQRRVPLVGNPQKLMKATGWAPSVSFEEMIKVLLIAEEESACV